jgi:DNA-binding NarL/FixJ family response regulator
MSLHTRLVESASLDHGPELAEGILAAPCSQSVALTLPGLWSLDEVVAALSHRVPTLYVDVTHGAATGTCALSGALPEDDFGDTSVESPSLPDRLAQWAHRGLTESGQVPWLVAESAHKMDERTAALLQDFVLRGALRLVLPRRRQAEASTLTTVLEEGGWLRELAPQLLSKQVLESALRARLGTQVSLTAQRRILHLSGGHVPLARRVVDIAVAQGVLQRREDMWMWEPDEDALGAALARESADLFSGLDEAEQNLLILTAVAGRLPEQWAVDEFSDEVVLSLKDQSILGPDHKSPLGALELRVHPAALRDAARRATREAAASRLWFEYGRRIPRTAAGPLAEAALVCWAARSGEPITPGCAEFAAEVCIEQGWYNQVRHLKRALTAVPPFMRMLGARAESALGDIAAAADELQQLTEHAEKSGGAGIDARTQRGAVTLLRRISLFHPEVALPILDRLTKVGPSGQTPYLDRVVEVTQTADTDEWLRELMQARRFGGWSEAVTAQLWVGVKLGLRRHPELGRLVLSSLLDDLVREGGQSDVEETVVAVLLMIMIVQGWRTDMIRVDFHTWNGRAVRGPVLPGVTNVVAAIVAMQQGKMYSSLLHASAAMRAFDISDPYGLGPFSASFAMAAAAFTDAETSAQTRRDCAPRVSTGPVRRGLPSLRLATQGMALIGSDPPDGDVASRLVTFADQAAQEDEWIQEQQLLLLATLGMSADAAGRVLEAPWRHQPGRPSMISMLAEALTTTDDHAALETAEVFIGAKSQHFGLVILSAMWARRDELPAEIRARVAKTVMTQRHKVTEPSWILNTFSDLNLCDRERSVLEGLHRGDSTRVIARTLNVSPRTVEATVSTMLRRFGCTNRVELIALDLLAS